jgi:hypothetical protein
MKVTIGNHLTGLSVWENTDNTGVEAPASPLGIWRIHHIHWKVTLYGSPPASEQRCRHHPTAASAEMSASRERQNDDYEAQSCHQRLSAPMSKVIRGAFAVRRDQSFRRRWLE